MIGGGSAGTSVGEVTIGVSTVENIVVKAADTLAFAFSVTLQPAMPPQAPPHPARPQAAAAVAVRVTWVPLSKFALQVEPQSIPAGELVTLPPGLPISETERVEVAVAKLADTFILEFIVTVQVPVPAQPLPLQPVKVEPLSAVAVKVTDVSGLNCALQVDPQLIPEGELVTVPVPAPDLPTVRV
jgi:hypothetical protein